jgi:TonB family protein
MAMPVSPRSDVFSAREIALAAGVAEAEVAALLGRRPHVPYGEALDAARALMRRGPGMFSRGGSPEEPQCLSLAVSGALHAGAVAAVLLITSWAGVQTATTGSIPDAGELTRLVFLAVPGPGGGGGGGGLSQKAPAPKALRAGHEALASPLPPPAARQSTTAPLDSEPLPVAIAPIVMAQADSRTRIGLLIDANAESDSGGSGRGGGAGTGSGGGLGQSDGSGVGHGSGGGLGGGPYRPGSGIEPPRILQEIKADYSEDARRRGIAGNVVLEIVVRRDGSVGDVKVLEGLDGGLSERAVQAVRQWRFAPARRLGAAVDVVVEVAVEFKLR